MKRNDYLFAVASVRALENSLLKQSDLEQLINAEDYQRAAAIVSEKGYPLSGTSDYSAVLDSELENAWNYVITAAPEAEELKTFIVKNDFQNLKAVLKAEVMNYNASDYAAKPSVIPFETLLEAVSERRFDELPEFISEAAEKAFGILTKTGSAQLCDAVADTAALEAVLGFASVNGDLILKEYAEAYCLAADIKTAYRAVKTGKNEVFLDMSVAECEKLNKSDFIAAALGGMDSFLEYLSSAGLSDYKAELEKSSSSFEKYCDDKMLEIIKKAKMTAFGVSPLAAYYVAKETEIKCLRIILSAKLSFVSGDVIRERMRELYV
ncbi:MAG: V-type ATPase subunit [Eubacterium sp.]|nr:V-type ATPase subunit [Eubacterium sp.]